MSLWIIRILLIPARLSTAVHIIYLQISVVHHMQQYLHRRPLHRRRQRPATTITIIINSSNSSSSSSSSSHKAVRVIIINTNQPSFAPKAKTGTGMMNTQTPLPARQHRREVPEAAVELDQETPRQQPDPVS
uniref:Putative secreted protein n=1 Tax=Anopheles darlingi TaxID=43151 RepID=A0A2M4DEA5_ANODA